MLRCDTFTLIFDGNIQPAAGYLIRLNNVAITRYWLTFLRATLLLFNALNIRVVQLMKIYSAQQKQ